MRRAALAPGAGAELGEAAAEILMATPEFQSASCVALFASLPDEIPTRPLFERVRSRGRVCALPRIVADGALDFALAPAWENLHPGRYGVREPAAECTSVALGDVDLIVIPGLAFDGSGGRLGRGGGYYDRALLQLAGSRRARAPVFGLAHDWQVVDDVPRNEDDQLVDAIVTERRIIRVEVRCDD